MYVLQCQANLHKPVQDLGKREDSNPHSAVSAYTLNIICNLNGRTTTTKKKNSKPLQGAKYG